MPLKKEPCRNFQRGSCRYGDKCKFLHVTQQQPRSNAFGFGSQAGSPFQQTNMQQQKPNPFGFGVQNSGPAIGAFNSGGLKQSSALKPFENKWVRSEQPANQSQAASHSCTDPESCKRQIAEDFQQERPLWKLTCYGHYKSLPCDITGDVSYEELRAMAYDEAKRGISLQSIVERERNMLNSKLVEFENLLRNPYTKPTNFAQSNQSPFPAVGSTTSSLPAQNTGPPALSGFGQMAPSPNMAFGVRPSNPPSNAFGQFQGSPGPFGTNNTPSRGSPGPFRASNTPSGGSQGLFGTSNMSFGGSPGPFGTGNMPSASTGSQVSAQNAGNHFASNAAAFGNNSMNSQGSQSALNFSALPQTQTPTLNQPPAFLNGPIATNGIGQMSTNIGTGDNNVSLEVTPVDQSIWMKEDWKLGEIPEQSPPAQFVK